MTNSQTVLLAGAGGVFGRHITRVLTAAGHQVLGMGRGGRNAISADLLDRDSVLRALDGVQADLIVHAATALRKPPMANRDMYVTNDLRIAGTRHLVQAADLIGARRFIGENIAFGYGYRDFGDRILTEADLFGGVAAGGDGSCVAADGSVERKKDFARHVEAMRVKEQLPIDAGLDAVSLRFGLFYGDGGTQTMVEMIRRRRMPAFNDHGRVLPWINLADAATAVLAAIERGTPGQAYNIADDSQLGFGGMVRAVADSFGLRPPMTVPLWMTAVMPYAHRAATCSLRVSSDRAHAELGWQPTFRTVADGLRALAAPRSGPVSEPA